MRNNLLFLISLAFSSVAFAQSACVATAPITLDCTSRQCTMSACWPVAVDGLSKCFFRITTATGALPTISGVVTTPGLACEAAMPRLLAGEVSITASGVNPFGEGVISAPLALTTGLRPLAPSGVAVR